MEHLSSSLYTCSDTLVWLVWPEVLIRVIDVLKRRCGVMALIDKAWA